MNFTEIQLALQELGFLSKTHPCSGHWDAATNSGYIQAAMSDSQHPSMLCQPQNEAQITPCVKALLTGQARTAANEAEAQAAIDDAKAKAEAQAAAERAEAEALKTQAIKDAAAAEAQRAQAAEQKAMDDALALASASKPDDKTDDKTDDKSQE
jgi:uncharacterized membrane protein YqiK